MEFNDVNLNYENVVTINCNLFLLYVIQNCQNRIQDETSKFFLFRISQVPTKHDFLYLSLTYQNGMKQSFACS